MEQDSVEKPSPVKPVLFILLMALAYVGLSQLISDAGAESFRTFSIGLIVSLILWVVLKYSGIAPNFFGNIDQKKRE